MPSRPPKEHGQDPQRIGGHIKNLVGRRSGTLVVERYISTLPQGGAGALQMATWECRCTACGAIEVKQRRYIVAKQARCGACTARRSKIRKDLTGRQFGRLTVRAAGASTARGESQWDCVCACGGHLLVRRSELVNGDTRSCGCLRVESTVRNQRAQARQRRHARGLND